MLSHLDSPWETRRSTFSAKKTFGSSKIGWKDDDGERFSTPANPQMKPYIQTIPKVDWFPEQKTADQMYSRKKKKRKSSLVERMFLG